MMYREFIVVARGGHETQLVKAPRPVTIDYARKNAWRWTKVNDVDSEEEDEYGYSCNTRPMRKEECAYVYPWERGCETYRRDYDGHLVCLYLPYMNVLGGIERGENTPMRVAKSCSEDWNEYELYARIFAQLRQEGAISFDYNKPINGYHFN